MTVRLGDISVDSYLEIDTVDFGGSLYAPIIRSKSALAGVTTFGDSIGILANTDQPNPFLVLASSDLSVSRSLELDVLSGITSMVDQGDVVLWSFDSNGSMSITSEMSSASARIGDSSNNTYFETTGHQTMTGSGRPWRDQLTDAINIKIQGSGIQLNSADSTMEFATNADYNTDFLYLNMQLNHDKDLTSSIYPHIHFFQTQNNVPNFLLEYRWQKTFGGKTTAWTKLKCNTLAQSYSGTTKNNIAQANAIIPPSGSSLSDIIQFKIYRDTANDSLEFLAPDPYTTVVGVTAFDCHFQINSLGSTDEYTK